MRCELALAREQTFIGFRTIKIYYDIIDPKITKNLPNWLYQSRPPQAKNRT